MFIDLIYMLYLLHNNDKYMFGITICQVKGFWINVVLFLTTSRQILQLYFNQLKLVFDSIFNT